MKRLIAALMMFATPGFADGEAAGDFDYYVLALSWTPTWCALEGDRRGSPQCDRNTGYGFTLHGLWPQYDDGWPSFCRTSERPATRGQTGEMVDIMGSSGLAFHQWRKHGVCTGLDAEEYFALSRLAYEGVSRPQVIRDLGREVTLPAAVIEEAFLEANPDLSGDGVTVTCRADRVQEVRICLSRDLQPRDCGQDVIRDCTLGRALLSPIR
ncbi:ribonuclease T2 [Jannaschia faecimaris]|uniref:Ribonuclease T2 n=1 Tax=Jannaschia faecimaris TaxID=1244108 RepID=A0A1H3QZ56_9RHOB|nr:ribonuclease T2 [Jannaschia faecimaris]SDZ18834.1 ribonuclease T2 [Jannaschia faecimaris]